MVLEVDPETTSGSCGVFAVVMNPSVVFLVDYRVRPSGTLGVELNYDGLYPNCLVAVVDHPFEDPPGAGTKMALHLLCLIELVYRLVLKQHPAALALPFVIGEVRGGLVDLPAVVFVVN